MEDKNKDNNSNSKNNKSMCKHVFLDLNEKRATIIENVLNEYCVPYKKTESENNHGAGGNRGIAIIPFLIMPCDMDEDDFGCKYNIEVELISEPTSEGKLSPLEFVLKKVEERLALEDSYKLPTVEPKISIPSSSSTSTSTSSSSPVVAEIKNTIQVDPTKFGSDAFTPNAETCLTNFPMSYKNININKLSNCFEDIMQEILDEEENKNKNKSKNKNKEHPWRNLYQYIISTLKNKFKKNKKKYTDNKKVPKAFEELMGWNSKSNSERKDRKDNKSHLSGLQPIHEILPYVFADLLSSTLYSSSVEAEAKPGVNSDVKKKEKEETVEKAKAKNNNNLSQSASSVKFDELPEQIKGILRSSLPESVLKSDKCKFSYSFNPACSQLKLTVEVDE